MTRFRPGRLLATALALASASIHLLLSTADLIPGVPTMGPLFAAMGAGYVGVAAFVLLARPLLDQLALLYTGALLLAYVASRLPIDTPLPVEPIGVATKVIEAVLLILLIYLMRAPDPRPLSS